MLSRACALVVFGVSVPAFAEPASGAPPSPVDATSVTDESRTLFNEGISLAKQGKWAEATLRLTESQALRPHAVTAYNIGYCERALGQLTRARRMLETAIKDDDLRGGTELPADVAAAARSQLAELDRQVSRALVTISSPDAAIAIDGRPLDLVIKEGVRPRAVAGVREPGPGEPAPTSFDLEINPGEHMIVVSRRGRPDTVVRHEFAEGAQSTLDLSVAERATTGREKPRQQPAEPGEDEVRKSGPQPGLHDGGEPVPNRTAAYVALGVGAAGILTGSVAGIVAWTGKPDVESACPNAACSGEGAGVLERAKTAADVATVGFIVGAAGAGVGAALWFLGGSHAAKANERRAVVVPWLGLASTGVSGRF